MRERKWTYDEFGILQFHYKWSQRCNHLFDNSDADRWICCQSKCDFCATKQNCWANSLRSQQWNNAHHCKKEGIRVELPKQWKILSSSDILYTCNFDILLCSSGVFLLKWCKISIFYIEMGILYWIYTFVHLQH